jgi:polyhydroxyalkanoate synthesis regulator phasin
MVYLIEFSGGCSVAAKTKVASEETKEPNPLFEAVRKVLLAGVGVVALTVEAVEDLIEKLVERGELTEDEGRKLVQDIFERRKKDAKKAEEEVNKRVDELMARFDIPTKAEFENLSAQISDVSKKVDELKKG